MTGWPWPLDGVEAWFENLYNWIGQSAVNAVSVVSGWIWDASYWLRDRVSELSSWLNDRVNWARNWLADHVQVWSQRIINGVWEFSQSLSSALSSMSAWIVDRVNSARDDLARRIADLGPQISQALGLARDAIMGGITSSQAYVSSAVLDARNTIITMFDGGMATISGWVDGALKGVAKSLGEGLQATLTWFTATLPTMATGAAGWLKDTVLIPIWGGLTWLWNWITGALTGVMRGVWDAVKGISDRIKGGDPAAAFELLATFTGVGLVATGILSIAGMKVLGTGIEVGEIGKYVTDLLNPSMLSGVVIGTLLGVAIRTPLTQYYNKWIRPSIPDLGDAQRMMWRNKIGEDVFRDVVAKHGYGGAFEEGYVELARQIPGSGDLVRMVVREAFDPKMVIKAPAEFSDAMKLQGFAAVWSDRYWTAHYEPIALRQAYENLWRGYWQKEQFMFALHIADVHPMWREDIYRVAFGPPSARELGYGFDTGLYSVEDIAKYRRWAGLAPEDADKAARAMVAYRTESEREALRREALADFEAWLDDESQLRVNLKAIGGRDEVVDLWVERAKYRRERDFILAMIKVSVDLHYKGHIDDQGLDQDLIELGITPDGRQKIITEAKARRLKAVVAEKAAKKKVMPEARVRQARDLGLIGDVEYVRRLLDHDWTEEDARLDLAIELTPKPVTIEEMERRKRTVTSKLNRATRRYEISLARVQDQIDATAAGIDDTRVTMEESLGIIDAQIAIIDEELGVATPERAVTLAARRVVLEQRRELQVTRWETRIRELTEQHKNLLETRDLVTRQRDEELAEYDNELRILEVAG